MAARKKAVLRPTGVQTSREKLWAAMREQRTFTMQSLCMATKIDRLAYNPYDYIDALQKGGIVRLSKPAVKPHGFAEYELVQDMGVDAPRVRKDGTICPPTAQTRMWNAMRVLKLFSVRDLVVYASLPGHAIATSAAAAYVRWLERGGYLAALPRERGDVARWRLVRFTGPKAPQILRVKKLFDANINEITAEQKPAEALDDTDAADIRGGA